MTAKISSLVVLFVLLLPSIVCAGPIPKLVPSGIAPLLPPPILGTAPSGPVVPSVQSQPPASDAWKYLSGIRYYLSPEAKALSHVNDAENLATPHARDSAFLGSLNMSTDTIPDVEPSVIAISKNGTIWTTSVYTKRSNFSQPLVVQNYFSTTSDFVNVSKGPLPLYPGYQFSGDPFLAANPYSTGVAPGRVYASGALLNLDTPETKGLPNAVVVWNSDDGGQSWSSPTFVAIEQNPDFPGQLDKPAIAVSWHPNTLGHVYVAYVRFPTRQLYIAKSTDGGLHFGLPVPIPSLDSNINGAQVLVNPFYGTVYVLWTDFTTKTIRMSTSTDFGQTWSQTPEPVVSINPVLQFALNGNAGPRAPSFPMARFNPVANRISVVWHEYEQPGSPNTDVYYTSRSSSGLWQPKVRVNDVQSNDQFFPALDLDNTGNMVVTFYDRRNDPANWLYQVFSARIDPNGNRLEPNQLVSAFQSNPSYHDFRFIGDYQDTWSQQYGAKFYFFPVSVGIPAAQPGDVYVSAIDPVAEFADVPPSYWAYASIKAVETRGSMFGCGGGNFCPTAFVDRKMLADYIIVGMHQTQSSAAYNAYFDDIANDSWAPFINRAKELGITGGCGTRLFCPNSLITRSQAAVFIIRGMNQTVSTASYNAYFDDIPNDVFAPYINRMYELGITSGCGFRLYCPNNTLHKDEMAVFLNRAFPS